MQCQDSDTRSGDGGHALVWTVPPGGLKAGLKRERCLSSVLGSGKAGTMVRKCKAPGPLHGTEIVSLNCEEGEFRGEIRIRSQGSGVPS